MGYKLAGWVEFVIEVQYVADESADLGAFMKQIEHFQAMEMLELLPAAMGGPALGAMVEGQGTSSNFVRVSCPAHAVEVVLSTLRSACDEAFPRVK